MNEPLSEKDFKKAVDESKHYKPTITMIPSGALGEKYVKMISGDETMTVHKFADKMSERAKKTQQEIDQLINGVFE